MLDGSPAQGDEANVGNVENNKPLSLIVSNERVNTGIKTKASLLKKGGRKLRTAATLHLQKPPRHSSTVRLSDHNNNNTTSTWPPSAGHRPTSHPSAPHPAGPQHGLTLHVRQGSKRELLKSKGSRLERGGVQPGSQPTRNQPRHDQIAHIANTRSHKPKQNQTPTASSSARKNDNRTPKKPSSSHQPEPHEEKKLLHASDNVKILSAPHVEAVCEYLKESEKVYAGAKFSEPPSPSVLPKPPSHWVGENQPPRCNQSREQMTVHLKSLLKVQE